MTAITAVFVFGWTATILDMTITPMDYPRLKRLR